MTQATYDDFAKLDIRVGRIVQVDAFPKARRPAWKLRIDFGPLGVKSSSEFIFYVLTLPSGPYFKDAGEGPGAINVLVTRSTVRSAPGGKSSESNLSEPVTTTRSGAAPISTTRRADSSLCMQKRSMSASTRRKNGRTIR